MERDTSPPPSPTSDQEQAQLLPRADVGARARLLQALPQLALSQWLADGSPSAQDAGEDGAAGRRRPIARQDWDATASPRSRRRSASSASAAEVSAQRARLMAHLSLRRSESVHVQGEERAREFVDARDGSGESAEGDDGARDETTGANSDPADADDQSAMEELQGLFRRCHHSLPFVALFLVYFAYQHATGIMVFVVGTIAIIGLDQRVRAQVALKDKASILHLIGIVGMCAIDMVALCTVNGEPNPFLHFSRMLEASSNHKGALWDVIWIVIVNDFMIRLCSLGAKAIVAAIKTDKLFSRRDRSVPSTTTSDNQTDAAYVDSGSTQEASVHGDEAISSPRPSTATFYRRKRKLYGIIEMFSIFFRSLLAGVPWCSYYQLCSSQFMADVFTFGYLFIKGLVLGTQGRRIIALIRSFVTLGLEFGAHVTPEELAEAGSPDCSICYEQMQVPVRLSCSHMFCEECVMEWFDRERSCPLCRASVGQSTEVEDGRPQFLDGSTSLFPQLL